MCGCWTGEWMVCHRLSWSSDQGKRIQFHCKRNTNSRLASRFGIWPVEHWNSHWPAMFPPYVAWLSVVDNLISSPAVKINKWNVGIWNATKWVTSLETMGRNASLSLLGHSSLSWTSERYLFALTASYAGHSRLQWSWFGGTSMFRCVFLWTWLECSIVQVWDMRTKAQIHCLTGHTNTVASVKTQAADPQVRYALSIA